MESAEYPTRTVSYLGVLQQALRDLSAWVEKDVSPPATTSYTIEDGQVTVPATAAARKGIQPVVTLKANGEARAEVQTREAVTFTATIELPPGTGKVVLAHWDFEGDGTFPISEEAGLLDEGTLPVSIESTHTFSKPGVYFPTLRVASHREGDATTPFARIYNLGRMRVIVR